VRLEGPLHPNNILEERIVPATLCWDPTVGTNVDTVSNGQYINWDTGQLGSGQHPSTTGGWTNVSSTANTFVFDGSSGHRVTNYNGQQACTVDTSLTTGAINVQNGYNSQITVNGDQTLADGGGVTEDTNASDNFKVDDQVNTAAFNINGGTSTLYNCTFTCSGSTPGTMAIANGATVNVKGTSGPNYTMMTENNIKVDGAAFFLTKRGGRVERIK
jgi:hypothetical protein